MEGLLDRTSPRRGSLTSLHRQSSGSISSPHNPKLAATNHHQVSSAHVTGSSSAPGADIDKYTRYFIIKAVQIIVQSRIGSNKEFRSECKPGGNDWFNINLTDIKEITERTKSAIDSEGVSTRHNWQVCCEISLKTGDETRVVLEQWFITNRSLLSATPPLSSAISPSATSTKNLKPGSQNSLSGMNATGITSNNNSINSLQQQQPQASSNHAPSLIYTIYNRMTLLLKTIMTTVHIVPAFRLTSKVTRPCVICYQIFTVSSSSYCQNLSGPGLSSPIKNDTSADENTTKSVDTTLRLGIVSEVDQNLGPILKLGSIKTETNELSILYRTDVNNSGHLASPKALVHHLNHWNYGKVVGTLHDEDYLVAAKQLLAGNGNPVKLDQRRNPTKTEDSWDQPLMPAFAIRTASTPPRNASVQPSSRVHNETNSETTVQCDAYGELIESAFDRLLDESSNGISENTNAITEAATTSLHSTKNWNIKRSANIQVPGSNNNVQHRRGKSKSHAQSNQPSSESTPKSISDSFVFVDIKPPFASDEQNDINSFFHGPSPSFSNGFDTLRDVEELTNQLATIEANASQIDDFVDTICASEDEEAEVEGNVV